MVFFDDLETRSDDQRSAQNTALLKEILKSASDLAGYKETLSFDNISKISKGKIGSGFYDYTGPVNFQSGLHLSKYDSDVDEDDGVDRSLKDKRDTIGLVAAMMQNNQKKNQKRVNKREENN